MPLRRCHRPTGSALWQGRRAGAALGVTCLLLGGAGVVLGLYAPQARLWQSAGELRGVYVAEAPDPPVSTPQPPVPEPPPPAFHLPYMQPRPLEPEPPPEAEPMAAIELPPVQSHLLLGLPPQDFSAAPRPVAARRAPAPPPPQAQAPPPAAVGPFTPPAYRSAPRPPFPAAMRQSRVEGSVRLRIFLDAEGVPQRVEIIIGSGHSEFDSTAREWVLRHWRFKPARQGSTPVPATVVTSVQFTLSTS